MIEENIAQIKKNIAQAATASGRTAQDITFIAVSKNHGLDKVRIAHQQGLVHFGENKLQEAMDKFTDTDLRQKITLHFIGHMQSNKVKKIVRFFDVIHSVDRPSVAEALAKEKENWQEAKPFPQLLIEVNVGKEPQKSGVMPEDLEKFFYYCRDQLALPIVGLMAILPLDLPPSPFFVLLKQLTEKYQLPQASMGMTHDYPQAIELGATMVRIGTGVFGTR